MSSDGKRMEILDYNYLSEIPQKPPAGVIQGFYLDQKTIFRKWIKAVVDSLRKRELLTCLHHYILISKYIESIKADSDPPVKPEDGRKTIELLECIQESLNKNQPVKMKSIGK